MAKIEYFVHTYRILVFSMCYSILSVQCVSNISVIRPNVIFTKNFALLDNHLLKMNYHSFLSYLNTVSQRSLRQA